MKHRETNAGIELLPGRLRDQASRNRVEAIWRRIEDDLPLAGGGGLTRRRIKPLLWVAAAFVGGVAFGIQLSDGSRELIGSATLPSLRAEPTAVVAARGRATSEELSSRDLDFALQGRPSSGNAERPASGGGRGSRPSRVNTEPAPVAESNSTVTPDWQSFAERGDYEEALKAIEATGGFDAELASAGAERLMLLGDVARVTGNRKLAAQALRMVVHEHAADPVAPLAAWSLGNMLEKAGDRVGAAEAFAMYRALSPQGDFAEDALASQVRIAVEQSDLELAVRLAAQYEKSFPDGRRAKEIREQLERLREHQPKAASDAPDAGEHLGVVPAPMAEPAPQAPSSDPTARDQASGPSQNDHQ